MITRCRQPGRTRRFITWLTLFFFLGAGLNGPVAYGFSVGEEREIGEKLLTMVRQKFTLLEDPDIVQYIDGLGRGLLKDLGPQYFDFHFFVISNKTLNAFAAPSGLIFLHSGLIETVAGENELVSVIAHEIGHVERRHIADRIDKSSKIGAATVAMILAGIVMGESGGGALSEALITGSMAAGATLGLKFSRQDEEEADRLAFKWMQDAGRDPAAMVGMLRELRRIYQFQGGNLPSYLLTHPEPGARLGYVQDLLLFSNKKQYQAVDEFDFQRIKARVLSLSHDPETLIGRYGRIVANAEGDADEIAMAHYGLALAYMKQARFAEAEAALARTQARYPAKAMLKADQGVLLFEAGRYQEALPLFTVALAAEPRNAYAGYYLARALHQTGNSRQALKQYEELLAVLPEHPKLYYEIGTLKAELKETGAGYYYLGMSYWHEGNREKARSLLEQAVKALPAGDPLRVKAETVLARIMELEEKEYSIIRPRRPGEGRPAPGRPAGRP